MRVAATALAVALTAALPSAAEAKRIAFGSALTAPANRIEAHGADSVFWAKKLPGGARVRVPGKGRVSTIKLKGHVVKHGNVKPVTLFHFQILHPQKDGRVKVILTSGPFHVPVGGDRNRITTYHPVNLCARQGDYVAFNNVGGYKPPAYPNGTPFRVFSNVAGATTNFFTKNNGTNNNAKFRGTPHQGEELLMRMAVLTGEDAGFCRNFQPRR